MSGQSHPGQKPARQATAKTDASILPLRLEGVFFERQGHNLIDNLTLTLGKGPRTILLGPNGAGKSLTLRLCHGLISPTHGTVTWQGGADQSVRLAQAMVFQRPVMLRRSVHANIDYALCLRKIPKGTRKGLIEEALARAGLTDFTRRSARVLSAGEQQRLALARAWALAPQVLFLDEPTANLDPASTRAVEDMITAIDCADTKIIMTTHDLGQAKRLADEIIFLHAGKLLEQVGAARFFENPASKQGQAYLNGELLW